MRKKIFFIMTGLIGLTVLSYNACSIPTHFGSKVYGTETTNPMTPIFEQVQERSVVDNSSQVSMPSFANPVLDGDLILCVAFYNSATQTVSNMNDGFGNTYWHIAGIGGTGGTPLQGWTLETWYTPYMVVGGANLSITAIFTGAFSGQKNLICNEYSGVAFPSPIDNVSAGFGFGANISSTSLVSSYPKEIIFGVGVFDSPGATSGPGFIQRASLNNIVIEDQAVITTGDYSATFSNSAMNWIANLVLIKGSGQ